MNTSRKLRLDLARYYRQPSVQVSIGVVLAMLITTFFIVFAIRPTFGTIVKLQKNIKDSRSVLKELEQKVLDLGKAASLLEKIKPQLSILETSIPSKGIGYDELSYNLEALAQSTSVTIDSFTIGKSPIQSRLAPIYELDIKQEVVATPITVRISGSYPNILQFLTKLAHAIRLSGLDNITVMRDGKNVKNSGQEELSMTITGQVYYLVDDTALQKIFPKEKAK